MPKSFTDFFKIKKAMKKIIYFELKESVYGFEQILNKELKLCEITLLEVIGPLEAQIFKQMRYSSQDLY